MSFLIGIAFIFGLFWGSFLKVLADRVPRSESPFGGRSYCEYCKHALGGLDLIPVFSYLFLGGKCRYCRKSLSLSYPISELATALVLITPLLTMNYELGIMNYEFLMSWAFYFFVLSGLIVIFFADLKYYIIPFQVLLPSIVVVAIWQWYFYPGLLMNYLLSGFGAFVFFLLIFAATRGRGMGFGDVVFAFYMGILLGFPGIIVGQYVAFLTGAVVSVILILTGKKRLKGGVVPFGPFLIFGTYFALFWGDTIGKIIMSYLYI